MSDSPIVEAETLVRQKHTFDSERPNTSAGSISSLASFMHPTMTLTCVAWEVAENTQLATGSRWSGARCRSHCCTATCGRGYIHEDGCRERAYVRVIVVGHAARTRATSDDEKMKQQQKIPPTVLLSPSLASLAPSSAQQQPLPRRRPPRHIIGVFNTLQSRPVHERLA